MESFWKVWFVTSYYLCVIFNKTIFYIEDKKNKSISCRLEIHGYDQVGVGKSNTKKNSKTEATKHFLQILASQKAIPALPKVNNLNTTLCIQYLYIIKKIFVLLEN